MPKVWNEDSLASLWSRQKTERLVGAGQLTPCGTDGYGRQLFKHESVMKHYTYARHQADDPYGGLNVTKVFGGARAGQALAHGGDEDDDGSTLLQDEYALDDAGVDPGGTGALEDDDGPGGVSLADYHDSRIKALADEERLALALEGQADALALSGASFGLAVGRLAQAAAVARMLLGR
jgi:hypothetical protein